MEIKLELIKVEANEDESNTFIFETSVKGKAYQDAVILCDLAGEDSYSWKIYGELISEHWISWAKKEFNEAITFA